MISFLKKFQNKEKTMERIKQHNNMLNSLISKPIHWNENIREKKNIR